MWANYNSLLKDVAEFTKDVFPGKMIQKVVTNYDGELNKTTQKIFGKMLTRHSFLSAGMKKQTIGDG